jgi:hypothetical protein
MVAEEILEEHMAACEQTYELMLDENRLLKTTGIPPGEDFLGQKRNALGQLDSALTMLRTLGDPEVTSRQRATISKTQQIVLKALLLDRENEQLLLKCTTQRRSVVPQARPTLDQIQRLYRKHGGGAESMG